MEGVAVALGEDVAMPFVHDLKHGVKLRGADVHRQARQPAAAAIEAELREPHSLQAHLAGRFG